MAVSFLADTPRISGLANAHRLVLANIYLHYVFDLWAERWRRHHGQGNVILVRYADDIVAGFEHQADAERFQLNIILLHRALRGSVDLTGQPNPISARSAAPLGLFPLTRSARLRIVNKCYCPCIIVTQIWQIWLTARFTIAKKTPASNACDPNRVHQTELRASRLRV